MNQGNISILLIVFSNVFNVIKDNIVSQEEFVGYFISLLDSFENIIKRGNLIEYDGHKVLFKFFSPGIAIKNAVNILSNIKRIFGDKYDFTLFIDFGIYVNGVIGNDVLKKRLYEGECFPIFGNIASNPLAKGRILLTESASVKLVKQFRLKPFDIFKINDREVISIYIFEKIEEDLSDEWMYELEHQKEMSVFGETVDGLQKLKDGEVEKAKSIFLKHSEKDEIIQNFVGVCEIIQSEKISFEQLKRYAKLNTSVFAVFDYFSFIKIKNEEENPEDDINNTIPKNKTETTTVEEEEYICLEDVH